MSKQDAGELCKCGHLWSDHYDAMYCLHETCCCGPCTLCGEQFEERPVNTGACESCKKLQSVVSKLLENT